MVLEIRWNAVRDGSAPSSCWFLNTSRIVNVIFGLAVLKTDVEGYVLGYTVGILVLCLHAIANHFPALLQVVAYLA